MKEHSAEDIVDIRDILARMHDARVGMPKHVDRGMTPTEMAALRDCLRRLNEVLARETEAKLAASTG